MKKFTTFEIKYKDFSLRYGKGIEFSSDTAHLIEFQQNENFLIGFLKNIFGIVPKIIKCFF